ncbi:MAG: S49 family peptidase [Planctomycetes bacterium]|nr:S49 family peptidase [Planctomycetota bacterium]
MTTQPPIPDPLHGPARPPVPPQSYAGPLPPPPPMQPLPPGAMPPGGQPRPMQMYQPPRPRTGLWRTLGLVMFIGVIGFNALLFMGMLGGAGMLGGGQQDPHGVTEFPRGGGDSDRKIAVIGIDGVILEGGGGGLFGGGGIDPVAMVQDGLNRAQDDDSVAAVILEVNSPGGGVGASDTIHHAVVEFQKNSGKPVVVYMKDLAASGGYFVSAPSDWIVASRTTLTGSVGVVMQNFNFHGTLTEILKAQDATIKAGNNKAMGSMFADPASEEYKEGRALLQKLADDTHVLFKSIVRDGRGKSRPGGTTLVADWETYCDGRILSSQDALKLGFVDQIGYFEDAVAKAEALAGISGAAVVDYGRMVTLATLLGLQADDATLAAAADKAGPAIAGAQLTAKVEEMLRLYPGKPMLIWVP